MSSIRSTRSITKAIYDRLMGVNKRVTSGHLEHGDVAVLGEGYATPHGDRQLAMGRSDAARPGESDDEGIPFVITTLREDRDGDIVIPSGCRLENYARNPCVFWSHQQNPIPIGTSRAPDGTLSVHIHKDHIRAIWYPDYEDPDSDYIAGKVRRGVLSAASLAFVPLEAVRRDGREEQYESKARTDRSPQMPPGWIFKVFDMTEWSVVGIPSNAGAIRDSLDKEKAWISPRLQKSLSAYAAEARGSWQGGIGPNPTPMSYESYLDSHRSTFSPEKSSLYIHPAVAKGLGLRTQADMEPDIQRPTINPKPGTRHSALKKDPQDLLVIESDNGKWYVVDPDEDAYLSGPYDEEQDAQQYIQDAIDQIGMNSAEPQNDDMRDAILDRYKSRYDREQMRRERIQRAYGITNPQW